MKKNLVIVIFSYIFLQNVQAETVWECKISDNANQSWTFSNAYEKKAFNMVFENCKKESTNPESCHPENIFCEAFVDGVSTTPLWECTALDAKAESFVGNASLTRDESAMHAKALCKKESTVPDTCYVHFVTCINTRD